MAWMHILTGTPFVLSAFCSVRVYSFSLASQLKHPLSLISPPRRTLFPPFQKYVTKGYVSEEEAGRRLAQVRG